MDSAYPPRMPVRVVFRCEFCDDSPDADTQVSLEAQMQELRCGEYIDATPGNWLVWHGRGPYGPNRYACPAHRVALRELLRRLYGTLGWHPHARVLGDVSPELRRELGVPEYVPRPITARQRRVLHGYRNQRPI